MQDWTRRHLILRGLLGAGAWPLVGSTSASGLSSRVPHDPAEPRFFLCIMVGAGVDASYLFDGRPLAMTAAGKIQNYLGQEPVPWMGRNGIGTLASPLMAGPLAPFRDVFSVLTGVHMAASTDGHAESAELLLGGETVGDPRPTFLSFLDTDPSPAPIGFVNVVPDKGSQLFTFDTKGGVVMTPLGGKAIVDTFASGGPVDAPYLRHVEARLRANDRGPGQFSTGSRQMYAGQLRAQELAVRLASLSVSLGDRPLRNAARVAGALFRAGITRGALVNLSDDGFDTHSPAGAAAQPELFAALAEDLASVFAELRDTPYDEAAGISLLDRTTVLFCSEFSRTMRQTGAAVSATGTDHNVLGNCMLLGGRGIRGGLVVGATDLAALDSAGELADASPAHRRLDRDLVKAMGKPFDFGRMEPVDERPETYDPRHYLTVASVVNTVFASFGVERSRYRKVPGVAHIAPPLDGLLATT